MCALYEQNNSYILNIRRKLVSAECIFLRDTVGGESISPDELNILQQGENYLQDRGSLHTTELEVLLTVCKEIPNCTIHHPRLQKMKLDSQKLASYFLDSRYHNPKLLAKFVAVANHLSQHKAVHTLLVNHLKESADVSTWRVSPFFPSGVWALKPEALVVFCKAVISGKITSDKKARKYLKVLPTRVSLLVSCFFFPPPAFLSFLPICLPSVPSFCLSCYAV